MSQGRVVIMGASADRTKYGNKAVRAYTAQGWTVFPINPKADQIEGVKAYKSIRDVPPPIDRVTIYLPPAVALTVLEEIATVTPGEVFFNPGSDAPEVIERANVLGLHPIVACSIVDIGMSPSQMPSQ